MKLNKKAISFSVMFLFFLFTIQAQVSIAPKIGLSYSKLTGHYTNAEYMPGAFFGGMLNFRIHELYSLQTGMLLSGKGTTLNYTPEDDDAILISYLEIPLNSVLTVPAGSGYIQFFAGPYAGFAINARYKYLEDENDLVEKLQIGTSAGDEIKPVDMGINFGTGYLFEGLEVQIAYSRSFSSVSNLPKENLINNVITISIAYFLGNTTHRSQHRWDRGN